MTSIRLEYRDASIEVSGSDDIISSSRDAFLKFIQSNSTTVDTINLSSEHHEEIVHTADGRLIAGVISGHTVVTSWRALSHYIKTGDLDIQIGDLFFDAIGCEPKREEITYVVTDITDDYVRFESKECCVRTSWLPVLNLSTNNVMFNFDRLCNSLPSDLLNVMSPTTRGWYNGGTFTKTTEKIFVPHGSEIFGASCRDVNPYEQLTYYKVKSNRIRRFIGHDDSPVAYWTSSTTYFKPKLGVGVSCEGEVEHIPKCDIIAAPICFHISRKSD